ncbi:MAG TPA: YfhO family protein [Patescibacteria group bacterium]|nr:YfhO family protein [Patescibacteria group bacterium]
MLYFSRLFYPQLKIFIIPDIGQSDLLHGYYPIRYLLSASLEKNEFPLWTPLMANGYPIFADGQLGLFALPNLILFKFLPFFWAINISYVLIFFTIGIGTLLYARKIGMRRSLALFSALAFTFAGFNINQISHISLLQTISFFPLEFYLLEKLLKKTTANTVFLLAIVGSQQILSGNQQMTIYSIFSLFLYMALTSLLKQKLEIKKVFFILVALFFSLMLSAILLFPSYELFRVSEQSSGSSLGLFKLYPYPFKHLLNFVSPFYFGSPKLGTYPLPKDDWGIFWENNGYMGLIPLFSLLLVFFYRNKKIITFLTLLFFGILLILGKYSPLRFTFEFVPLVYFRVPSRFLFLVNFSVAILSGLLLQEFMIKKKIKNTQANIIVFFLIVFHIVNIFYYFYDYYPVDRPDRWFKNTEITRFLKKDTSHFRIYTLENFDDWNTIELKNGWMQYHKYLPFQEGLFLESNFYHGLPKANNVANLLTRRASFFNTFIDFFLNTEEHGKEMEIMVKNHSAKLLGSNAVKYFLVPKKNSIADMRMAKEFDNYSLYYNPYFIERAYVAYDFEKTENIYDISSYIRSDSFNPKTKVIIENEINYQPKEKCEKKSCSYSVNWIKNTPHDIRMDVYSNEEGILVLSDTYYPGWKVFLDGKRTEYFPVNIDQRGILLSKGKHTIKYIYKPLSFTVGFSISVFAYGSLFIFAMRRIFIRKK